MTASVTVDARHLDRGLRELLDGLANTATAMEQAEKVRADVARLVPVRSGRLRSTVTAGFDGRAATVRYGGGLPYANYIDHRTSAVDDGTSGADTAFVRRCEQLARKVVGKL